MRLRGVSKSFVYKLMKFSNGRRLRINPNKLARIYRIARIPRDKLFEDNLRRWYKDNGNTIRRLRIKKRLTMKELADLTGLNIVTIVRIENGKRGKPNYSIDEILRVLKS